MAELYLFDWGNTLMIDFPEHSGKMCDWPHVEAVSGAPKLLQQLAQTRAVYIATNAADSSESDIQKAFARVDLNPYISGYFCRANLGLNKGTPEFFRAILERLQVSASEVTMVGDDLYKDIIPADRLGIRTFWLTAGCSTEKPAATTIIRSLLELLN